MTLKLSLIIPGIRTNNWLNLYNSVFNACKKFSWEIVFISPFNLPEELKDKTNITLVKDFGSVPRCIQKGVLEADGELIFSTVDDCIFSEDSIDMAIELYDMNNIDPASSGTVEYLDTSIENRVIISMVYGEGGNLMDPVKYWTAGTHSDLRLPGLSVANIMEPKFYLLQNILV